MLELDPDVAQRAIEGYANELEGEKRSLDAFYRQHRCKRCGSACRREMAHNHVFSDADMLVPRSLLRCERCSFLFDPHTGMALELGPRGTP